MDGGLRDRTSILIRGLTCCDPSSAQSWAGILAFSGLRGSYSVGGQSKHEKQIQLLRTAVSYAQSALAPSRVCCSPCWRAAASDQGQSKRVFSREQEFSPERRTRVVVAKGVAESLISLRGQSIRVAILVRQALSILMRARRIPKFQIQLC